MYAFPGDGTLQPLGDPVVVGRVGVKNSVPVSPDAIGHAVGASFARELELLGYEAARQDGTLAITLHWRGLKPIGADYTVFVHLLDANDQVITQHDSQPQGGAYPTSVWDVGEVVEDTHLLSLPADLAPPPYRLRIGLYLLETGERLPVEGGGDSVELGPLDLGN
jgi:hypothetical protein